MNLWIFILPLAATAFIIVQWWRKREILEKLSHFPSISIFPVFKKAIFLSEHMKDRIMIIFDVMKNVKFPAKAWIYNGPLVGIGSAPDMKTVLNKAHDRGMAGITKDIFGNGMVLSTGEKWHKSRRLTSTSFSVPMMQHYLVIFNEYSAKLVHKIESFANTGETVEMSNYVDHLNLDMIIKTMANYESKVLENDDHKTFFLMERISELCTMRLTQPLLYPDFMNKMYLYFTDQWKIFDQWNKFIENIIHAKIEEIKLKKLRQAGNSQEKEKNIRYLLDVLIKAHETDPSYTEECIKDDFVDIIFAGSGTTTRTVSFALLMLAIHQDVQEKLHQEITTIFGNSKRSVDIDDLSRLVYLDQCVKETLRKYPALTFTFRVHSEDIALNEQQTIPASCNILVAIYALHHDKTSYPNADFWDPDHFAPEAVSERDKLNFLPFGTGPRSCIGSKYAMISIKIQLIHLLLNYHFETDIKFEDIRLEFDMALKFSNGCLVKLRRRNIND